MKYRYTKALMLLGISLTLTACFNGSNKSNNASGEMESQVSSLANQSADSTPTAIIDPGALAADISTLFGQADADPVDVKDNDTAQSVINRLK